MVFNQPGTFLGIIKATLGSCPVLKANIECSPGCRGFDPQPRPCVVSEKYDVH